MSWVSFPKVDPQYVPILPPQPSTFGLISMLYGNGFVSLVVIGGICSLSRLTIVSIFKVVLCNDELIAFMTFVRSGATISNSNGRRRYTVDRPSSVLGVASVTSNVQFSQHTSSSPFTPVNQPRPPPAFRLFFSKKCTVRTPRTLLLGDEEVALNCRDSCPTR